jgi:hypothetical protein
MGFFWVSFVGGDKVGATTCCSGSGGIMGLGDGCYFGKMLSVRSSISDTGWVFIVGTVVFLPLSLHVGEAGLYVELGRDRFRRGFLG